MYTDGCVALSWVRFGDLNGVFGFLEVGTCYHEFLAAGVHGALDHVFKVIFVPFGAVVFSPVDGICEVDADLGWLVVDEVRWGDADRHRCI